MHIKFTGDTNLPLCVIYQISKLEEQSKDLCWECHFPN